MSDKHKKQTAVKLSGLYGDYLVMLIAPLIFAVYQYGARALAVVAVGVAGAVVTDIIFCLLLGRPFLLRDLSNIFTGAAMALVMPAGVPLYVPAAASFFAVGIVKIPFGGSLRSPFVPGAAGLAFASVCFKEQIFDYSYNSAEKLMGEHSLGYILSQGKSVHLDAINILDILSGNVAVPMGAGCALLMIACCAVLLMKRKKTLLAVAGFVVVCAAYAAIFPRVNASAFTSVFLELSSGSLLFAAVFFLTDYASLPDGAVAKLLCGGICGIFCMLMRTMGTYEETVFFAVLLANGFTPVINSAAGKVKSRFVKKEAA